ncbi:MAG: SDR family oxidoreductase [Candidatus Nanoarchaeia archaeon]|nr:SDR family oxidoreductase [Candidatus Jingweiarchaeum tengchongense]
MNRNKVAIVTGASSGIGREVAIKLSEEGYYVVNVSRRSESKEGGEPTHLITKGEFIRFDLSLPVKIDTLLNEILTKLGKNSVDVLVCNAGHILLKPPEKYTLKDIEVMLNVHLVSHFLLTVGLIKLNVLKKGATVIFISSTSGIYGEAEDVIYGAVKGSMFPLTKGLVKYYGSRYRFNVIVPGIIGTWLVGPPATIPFEMIRKVAVSRPGNPKEVAELVFHVISNEFINGSIMVIDGGRIE